MTDGPFDPPVDRGHEPRASASLGVQPGRSDEVVPTTGTGAAEPVQITPRRDSRLDQRVTLIARFAAFYPRCCVSALEAVAPFPQEVATRLLEEMLTYGWTVNGGLAEAIRAERVRCHRALPGSAPRPEHEDRVPRLRRSHLARLLRRKRIEDTQDPVERARMIVSAALTHLLQQGAIHVVPLDERGARHG